MKTTVAAELREVYIHLNAVCCTSLQQALSPKLLQQTLKLELQQQTLDPELLQQTLNPKCCSKP